MQGFLQARFVGRLPPPPKKKISYSPPPNFLLTLFLITLSPLPLGYSPPQVLQLPQKVKSCRKPWYECTWIYRSECLTHPGLPGGLSVYMYIMVFNRALPHLNVPDPPPPSKSNTFAQSPSDHNEPCILRQVLKQALVIRHCKNDI